MNPRSVILAQLRQASLAWTILLSLLLVWTGGQARLAAFPAAASLVAAQGPEQVATAAAIGKLHRAAEIRLAGDPDVGLPATDRNPVHPGNARDLAAIATDAPFRDSRRTRPEPRAPPLA